MRNIQRADRGAVSIFVVVFTTLLITVVTVSFVQLMMREQQRATNADLSQSAYDAALAGVEDAKRALSLPGSSGQDLSACNAIASVPGMNTVDDTEGQGRGIQVGSPSLRQWYSCVTVQTRTPDYQRTIGADELHLIQLKGVAPFDRIKIEWYGKEDMDGSTTINVGDGSEVPLDLAWPTTRPPVLEAQLMQTSGNLELSDFSHGSQTSIASNTNTLFLYPSTKTTAAPAFINDARIDPTGSPEAVQCWTTPGTRPYACSTTIHIPRPVGGTKADRQNAFLKLVSRFKGTQYRITLEDSAQPTGSQTVYFDGVQPEIDSTGRSGDLFRRVLARVEAGRFPYPEAAVDVTDNFCKAFIVTNNRSDYSSQCTP